MSFRRTGHSDERRRRVLMEDTSASTEAAVPATSRKRADKNGKTRNYSDAALAENQPPVTALVAKRPWTLSVLLLSALTVAVLLNLLHAESLRLGQVVGRRHTQPFDFASAGNLATWFSGMLLAAAAVLSLQVYNLRRHRVDDYRGRYRIWLWVTAALALASLDAVSGLHQALGGAMANLSGKWHGLGVELCWLAVAVTGVTFLGLRMGIEMRRSWGSLTALVLALTAYVLAVSVRLHWLPLAADVALQASVAATLLGHVLVWFTSLLYARYVYLDAQGLIVPKPPKATKPKKVKEADTKSAEAKPVEKNGKQIRIDEAHQAAPVKPAATAPAGPLKPAMISAATVRSPQSAEDSASDDRKLSKAERKRLRRQGRE